MPRDLQDAPVSLSPKNERHIAEELRRAAEQREEIVDFFNSLPIDEIVQYVRVTLSGALILAAIIVLYFAYFE